MCGINGVVSRNSTPAELRNLATRMASLQFHRGPDSDGTFLSPAGDVAFAFRRLAIRDLEPRANQPMHSADGQCTIVFNGEIYNTAQLIDRFLRHHSFRTHSDTEVLVELLAQHGKAVLPDVDGMFAFACFDARTERVLLARDRYGEKPLYIYRDDHCWAFASELRALEPFDLQIDPTHAPLFFRFGYLPAPHTFYRHVQQLEPGQWIEIDRQSKHTSGHYFRVAEMPWAEESSHDADHLDQLLEQAVASRLISDVPVGVFLSGGVDSSLVAACAVQQSSRPVPAFTVAFEDPRHDEAPYAKQIAAHLGMPFHPIRMGAHDLLYLLDDFLDCYEQPYADTSGLPTMHLCRQTRDHVTVALSGDGGDEFFAGYQRYDWFRTGLRSQNLPALPRRFAGSLLRHSPRIRHQRIGRLLQSNNPAELYASILRCWNAGPLNALLPDHAAPEQSSLQPVRDIFDQIPHNPFDAACGFDAATYISGDLQVKLDRASMRYSLEVRCPLLEPRLTAYGASRSQSAKWENGKKSLLRNALARRLPRSLFERPKKGFNVPLANWLRGPLKARTAEIFFDSPLLSCGWLSPIVAQSIWDDFHRGQSQLATSLWMLIVTGHHLQRHANSSNNASRTSNASREIAA